MIGKYNIVTGTKLWAEVVPGTKCDRNLAGFMVTVAADSDKGEEADDDEDGDDIDEDVEFIAGELHVKAGEYLGWRCSYKKGDPEQFHKQEARVRRVLRGGGSQHGHSSIPAVSCIKAQ